MMPKATAKKPLGASGSRGSDAVVEGSYVLVKERGRDQIRLDVRVQNAGHSRRGNGRAAEAFQIASHFLRRLIPVVRILFERLVNNSFQLERNIGIPLSHWHRRQAQN